MKTIRMDLNCFHTKVEILDQRTTFLEEKLNNAEYWGPDIWHLKQKVIDLEDRARRNNIRFYGIPEKMEVNNDVKNLLLTLIPRLLNISFEHPLELQRAHRIRSRTSTSTLESRPRSIIACLLRHEQVRQILTAARKPGPYDLEGHKVFIAADFSTETNAKRKAFLQLRLRLRKWDIKYGLLEPATMWITMDGNSRYYTEPEDLVCFLDSLDDQHMDSTPLDKTSMNSPLQLQKDPQSHCTGRLHVRTFRKQFDRDKAVHCVKSLTQENPRDKSRSPLKSPTSFNKVTDAQPSTINSSS
ncbi:hypothetical protein NDU88_006093 [Pleurodeles waltl]|uniref:L1 transposable element RRM domain-containing protein n=1 Tax=Pleurodeles waltl TaxID=8319 RepID=A0AAV7MCA9_PLEWA|nr:hypothetical protein NDU88_006093 [Pleurodeles waltl]